MAVVALDFEEPFDGLNKIRNLIREFKPKMLENTMAYKVQMPVNLIIEEQDGSKTYPFYDSVGDDKGLCPTWHNVPEGGQELFHDLYAATLQFITDYTEQWGKARNAALLESKGDKDKMPELFAKHLASLQSKS